MDILQVVINLSFIFGPSISYIKPYMTIKKSKDIGSFSHYICGVVIIG